MKVFVIDVDGCLTDGSMWYTKDGKVMKCFGADDHDALKMLSEYIHIEFVTGDYVGFDISKRRIDDMGFKLTLIRGIEKREKWIEDNFGLDETIYMGDSFMDADLLKKVGYSICPLDGYYTLGESVNYMTRTGGGHRAVAEACMHIKEKFLV